MAPRGRRWSAVAVLVAALASAGCGQSPSGPSTEPIIDADSAVNTTEAADGITFVRTTASLADAVRYRGRLTVGGHDRCLYVVIEGTTYLAAVGRSSQVTRDGVQGPDGVHALDAESAFSRLAASPVVPAPSAARCTQATELFGLGF